MPRVRQRVLIVVAMGVGAVMWLSVSPWLATSDGSSGLSMMSARVGIVGAAAVSVGAGLLAMGLGVIASAMGNPLSGVFAVSTGLGVLAVWGGSGEEWLTRSDLPGDYAWLMVEMLIWQVGVAVMLFFIGRLRSPVRAVWPALAYQDHLGVDINLSLPRTRSLAAGAVCAVCGLAVCWVMIQTGDVAQVIGSLVLGFGLGGVMAGMIFPQADPVGVLFAPAVVALVVYGFMLLGYENHDQVLAAWYGRRLTGLAVVLPIYYASAGVAGCAVGLGVAQAVELAKEQVVGV